MAHKGELLDSVIGPHPATGKPIVYHIVRCELCILTHIWPIPSEADLNLWYEREFYQNEKPDMIARYEADAEWWAQCMHGPTLDAAVRALATEIDYAPQLLDIGAGPGLLLLLAQERDWFTTAIEPSPLCAQRLREAKHSVWEGSLSSYVAAESSQRRFDIVTMWETLEHVPNPEETLLQVWDLLKPGGVVAICVPNEYGPAALSICAQSSAAPWFLAPPQHVNYFSPKTLQLLLRRTGFAPVFTRMTFPMLEHFILGKGENYIGNDVLGRACHKARTQIELTAVEQGRWEELEASYVANVEHRIGREIVAIATKNQGDAHE